MSFSRAVDRREDADAQTAGTEQVKIRTRLVELEDAQELTELLVTNEPFLAPWEPLHGPEFASVDARRDAIAAKRDGYQRGDIVPQVITLAGKIIGEITLSPIIRGVLQAGTVGYWVAESHNGQGHATAAVGQVCRLAFEELELHRVEAGTLIHNAASQQVLLRNGFTQYGLASKYLKIAGHWQDHLMFERINDG